MRRRAIALSCGVLALAGCGSSGPTTSPAMESGQAAVSEVFRISQAEVGEDVGLVLTGLGRPTGEPPAGLASVTTARLVLNRLIEGYAQGAGLEPTQAEVEAGLEALVSQTGGQDALNSLALAERHPAARRSRTTVRTNLLVEQIGRQLNAAGDSAAQVDAARVALTRVLGRGRRRGRSAVRHLGRRDPDHRRRARRSPSRRPRSRQPSRWASHRRDSRRRPPVRATSRPERCAAARADRRHGPPARAGRVPVGRASRPTSRWSPT